MKYIVVEHYRKGLSSIKILDAHVELPKPFNSWALNSGKRLLFAHNRMHNQLKSHYMMGNFQQGAIYAYDFEEMTNILTAAIGLDDEKAYEALLAQQSPRSSNVDKSFVALHTLGKGCEFLIWFGWGILKVVSFLLIIPFLISWLNKHK